MTQERILVVDDDELVRTGLVLDLSSEGYDVLEADSAEAALIVMENEPVQLVLSDLVMADMDGLNLLERIRARTTDVGFILITGHGTVDRALEAIRCGANDFVQKPADPALIRERVRAVLNDMRLRHNIMDERKREKERHEAEQQRSLRDQRMVSLGRLADGVAQYLAEVLEPLFDFASLQENEAHEDEPSGSLSLSRRKALSLINDLQTIGHSTPCTDESVRLEEVVKRLFASEEFARLKRYARGVRFECLLPPEPGPFMQGSSVHLEAMLRNLIAHSVEGMPDGGLLTVRVGGCRIQQEPHAAQELADGDYINVVVEDTAPFPPAQDMDRLFEPFQLRKIGDQSASTGLGLGVVYRMVQEHGGRIDVEVMPHRGTRYLLYFPVEKPIDEAEQEAAALTGNETILLVDDQEAERKRAVAILRDMGYRVLSAATGQSAVRVLQRTLKQGGNIDLVVLDLVLANAFDGLDTYRRMLEIQPDQSAIMVSGFGDYSRLSEARQSGVLRCVQKPYEPEMLGRAVRAALDQAGA
jgi:DNA-binding response OmpR family regulator